MKQPDPAHWAARWWRYQAERFPLAAYTPLILIYTAACQAYSAAVHGRAWPGPWPLTAGALSALGAFMLLRIADEFKDYAEDSQYRPYRPVPRGLVTLRALAWIGGVVAVLQAALALTYQPLLIFALLVVWAYFGLMSAEFFVPKWLKARPTLYLLSHAGITPLLTLYLAAWDWLGQGQPSPLLGWLLALSLFNGLGIEIGRKIRAPEDEEEGVETYSALWGLENATVVWLVTLAGAGVSLLIACLALGLIGVGAAGAVLMVGAGAWVGIGFVHGHSKAQAAWIGRISGLGTLFSYAVLTAASLWHIYR